MSCCPAGPPNAAPALPPRCPPGRERTVRGQACDVTGEQAVAGLIDQVLAGYGRLDVLVTSAGVQARGTLDQLSVATLRACRPRRIWPLAAAEQAG